MKSTFWSNTIWFILIGISTVIELIIILTKAKQRKSTLALYFSVCGITFTYEATICCFLKAYNYFPMVLPHLPLDEQLAGNLFSQFSVSATALLIVVLNLKYYWVLIAAGAYGIIEEFFIYLGIYKHNWYRTWMTVAGFILFFRLTKKMYEKALDDLYHIWRYIFIFLGLYTLHMITLLWVPKLLGIINFNIKILPDAMHSYALLALCNLVIISITCIIIYFSKINWWWKFLLFSALYAILYFAQKMNLIQIKEGWLFLYPTIDIFGMYFYVYLLDNLYDQIYV